MFAIPVLILIPLIALAPQSADSVDLARGRAPVHVSMGPDPGGHSGARVTEETTKTGQPSSDAARNRAEPNGSNTSGQQSPSSGAEKGSTQPDRSNQSGTKR
jgi:hypothetical protein